MVLTRIGILGGTFDPVHRGHLGIARIAMDEAALERVIFIPAGQPRLKSGDPSASPEQRLEMLRLAVSETPGFDVSDMELRRSGPTLTVETLRELRDELGDGVELCFVLGLDALARFDQWVEPERVTGLARLLAVSRPGYSGFDWPEFYSRNPYAEGRVDCLDSTAIDVSASELRARIASGASVGGLLPAAVEQYIRDNGLYRV
ncbi:MAG: nicotinate (nicotinamide) nucleotide adenylyltransferase [Chloroflexi bacterium]|nr:nicotinate (nicotinamide) nucleotide adenylyltransferase [Chloroflexota bacterium]MYE38729.1 nicotinate (nicotinamide) nucleotide adenylyltransferase [Chloroflexota bacterium]